MAGKTQIWCVLFMCLASVVVDGRMIAQEGGSACQNMNVKTLKFKSPPLTAKPGEVNNKYYLAEFPKGHIGIRSLFAEVVDQNGVPVPLSEMYLHHGDLIEFAVPKEKSQRHLHHLLLLHKMRRSDGMHVDATSIASLEAAPHHHKFADGRWSNFINVIARGAETRHMGTTLPAPYARESGKEIEGYETVWTLNVHAIDTRGAVNSMGCAECRCNFFNATTDEDGKPLPEGFLGGTRCCGDGWQCAVEEGFNGEERTFYFEYTWEYVDWNECVKPVFQFKIDITNVDGQSGNQVEFTVEGCGDADPNSEECVDTKVATFVAPLGGDLVYTRSHLHASALDASLWGEDGRLICRNTPIYGQGQGAGNEKGYLVGVKSCNGNPGTPNAMKIKQGEKLKYVVKSTKVGGPHTGLMALADVRIFSDGPKVAI